MLLLIALAIPYLHPPIQRRSGCMQCVANIFYAVAGVGIQRFRHFYLLCFAELASSLGRPPFLPLALAACFHLVAHPVGKGNACVVDPWSAAGLVTGILGVAATVLAILGAVAVAGWWAMLNNRVDDQVKALYSKHKKEIGKKLDEYVAVQQREMSERLGTVQTNLQSVESRINEATTDINELEKLTHAFLDVAVEGIMLLPASGLEEWAQKVTALHKFSKIPLKMADRYLDAVEADLPKAERELLEVKNRLSTGYRKSIPSLCSSCSTV